jgi:hypothetical protein
VISPAQGARIAAAVEAAYTDGALYPEFPEPLATDFDLIDYLTARDAVLGMRDSFDEQVFYGFLARSKADPKQYIVAIRGTETTREWVIDAEAVLVNHVHIGFFSLYSSMRFRGAAAVAGLVAETPEDATVTFIGHSLGAPLACYGMNDMIGQRDCYGMFYAMPKPGDAVFASAVQGERSALFGVQLRRGRGTETAAEHARHRFVPLHDVTTIPKSPLIPNDIVSNHNALNYAALLT